MLYIFCMWDINTFGYLLFDHVCQRLILTRNTTYTRQRHGGKCPGMQKTGGNVRGCPGEKCPTRALTTANSNWCLHLCAIFWPTVTPIFDNIWHMTILFPSSDKLRPSFLHSLERPGNEYSALTSTALSSDILTWKTEKIISRVNKTFKQ